MTNHKQFSGFLEEIVKNYPLYESVSLLLSFWGEGGRELGACLGCYCSAFCSPNTIESVKGEPPAPGQYMKLNNLLSFLSFLRTKSHTN